MEDADFSDDSARTGYSWRSRPPSCLAAAANPAAEVRPEDAAEGKMELFRTPAASRWPASQRGAALFVNEADMM